jgi:hypothetical protein
MLRILARAKAATDHAQLINSGHEKQKGLVSEPPTPGEALPQKPTVPKTGPLSSEKGKKGALSKLRMSPSKGVKRNRGGVEKPPRGKVGVPMELVKATVNDAPAGDRAPLKALRGGRGAIWAPSFAGGLEESQSGRDKYAQGAADLPALDGLNGTAEDEMQYSPSSMGMDVFKEAELRGLVEQMTGGGEVRRDLEPSQGLGGFLEGIFGNSCGSFAAALAGEGLSEGLSKGLSAGFPSSETAASGEETVEKGETERLELGPREVSDFVAKVGLYKTLFP